MLCRVKLDDTLLTCDQGNFNQITEWRWNRTLVTVVKDTCTTTVPPVPPIFRSNTRSHEMTFKYDKENFVVFWRGSKASFKRELELPDIIVDN